MSSELKTPLYEEHKNLGARIVPFAGWLMPVQYKGIVDEHKAVRNKAGLFDVSHMGELTVKGKDALACLQWLTTNNVEKLVPGKAQYSLISTKKGTPVDDIIIYCIAKDDYFICVNASNREKDFRWFINEAKEKNFNVKIENKSDEYAQLALQGPLAPSILQRETTFDLASLKPFSFCQTEISGFKALVSRTGYTGEDGFEIYLEAQDSPALWKKLLSHNEVSPCGLGARDTLRLEMKYALYGNDLDEEHTILEAGLGWVVKMDKGDFLGKEILLKQKSTGIPRKLIGFKMLERSIPRHGYKVFKEQEFLGETTSGSYSPSLDYGIGCAYVPTSQSAMGNTLEIEIRGKRVPAEIVKTPFYLKPKKDQGQNNEYA